MTRQVMALILDHTCTNPKGPRPPGTQKIRAVSLLGCWGVNPEQCRQKSTPLATRTFIWPLKDQRAISFQLRHHIPCCLGHKSCLCQDTSAAVGYAQRALRRTGSVLDVRPGPVPATTCALTLSHSASAGPQDLEEREDWGGAPC